MLFIFKWKGWASIKQNEVLSCKYILLEFHSTQDKEETPKKFRREKKLVTNKRTWIKLVLNFSSATLNSKAQWRNVVTLCRMILKPEVHIPSQILHEMWEQTMTIQTGKNSENASPTKSQQMKRWEPRNSDSNPGVYQESEIPKIQKWQLINITTPDLTNKQQSYN